MNFLNSFVDAATTVGNTARNVLSNVSQVASGFNSITNNVQDSFNQLKKLGQTNLGISTNLTPGDASVAGFDFTSSSTGATGTQQSTAARGPSGILTNDLFEYSLYNYHFTLSVLSKQQYNSASYFNNILGQIILASAGAAKDNDLVETASGKLDYHLDNLRIDGVAGLNENTGNTNALSLSFVVSEPYSMGLFFQALQVAAFKQGYRNYADVPILLTIKFTGHKDPDNLNIESTVSRKYIPLKIREIQMRVSKNGCTYDVEAYPYNESGFSDSFNQAKHDSQLQVDDNKPKIIQELLRKSEKSLKHVVNQFFKERVKQNTTTFYDEIDIVFPDHSRNDESVNKIGASSLGFSNYNKGETGFAADNFVLEDGVYKRGKMKVNPTNGVFAFAQGQLVTDIINQVILTSDYPKFALKKENWTAQGQIKWWKIDTKVYFKGEEDPNTGYCPKKIVYRVEEYLVDAQKFTNPNTRNPGIENKWNEVVKQYFYIYTGKNLDVLDLNIQFKNGFYKALTADQGKLSQNLQGTGHATGGSNQQHIGKEDAQTPKGGDPSNHNVPSQTRYNNISSRSANQGSAFQSDDPITLAARQFHDLATTGYDMLNLDLTILGDPFYITSSGTGNYRAEYTSRQGVNKDREMNYESNEIYVAVYFRTPVDHKPDYRFGDEWDGMYNFGSKDSQFQFSGLFRVLNITSNFVKGKFTQTLGLIRIPDQDKLSAPQAQLGQSANNSMGDDQHGPEILNPLTEVDNSSFVDIAIIPNFSKERTQEEKEYADGLGNFSI